MTNPGFKSTQAEINNQNASANSLTLAPVGLISLSGSKTITEAVNTHLINLRMDYQKENYIHPALDYGLIQSDYRIETENVRFSSGEGKAVIKSSIRGKDLYIFCDITNYSVTYNLFGKTVSMGPDDYYQDLKRVILATCGRARRINIVMPFLYQGRQDIRNSRESLDCAYMLNELFDLGVSSVITFDPHEPRVENAVPLKSLDAVPATFQLISKFLNSCPNIRLSGENGLMVVSPDEAGMKRAMYYASVLEVPLGTFFRQRDYSRLVDGRNPIVDFHYLGEAVKDRDVLFVDDILVTGVSMLETARKLKEKHARNIYIICTFGIFSNGLKEMNRAYEQGVFDKVFITNLSYISPELRECPWVEIVDMSEVIAHIIDAMNHNVSLAEIYDHTRDIKDLLKQKSQQDQFADLLQNHGE